MRNIILSSIVLAGVFQISNAALPPKIQQRKDSRVLDDFVLTHAIVRRHMGHIDYTNFIIYLDNCQIEFERETVYHLPGWVGPASKLELSKTNCEYDLNNSK